MIKASLKIGGEVNKTSKYMKVIGDEVGGKPAGISALWDL